MLKILWSFSHSSVSRPDEWYRGATFAETRPQSDRISLTSILSSLTRFNLTLHISVMMLHILKSSLPISFNGVPISLRAKNQPRLMSGLHVRILQSVLFSFSCPMSADPAHGPRSSVDSSTWPFPSTTFRKECHSLERTGWRKMWYRSACYSRDISPNSCIH